MGYYLGIDFGTSGCRAILIDRVGRVVTQAAGAIAPPQGPLPQSQQDPALWWEALTQTLAQIFSACDPAAIEALAVDGTSATLLVCDAQAEPLHPALMYNDARSTAQAALIATHAPQASAARGPTSSLAKLLWLQQRCADSSARYALHQADWVAARLTGRPGISDENNALKLGYDPVARRWPSWFDKLGVHGALLPRVVVPGTAEGHVCAAAATALGLSQHTQVVAGTTDSTAAFIAAGASEVGDAVTSLGSTLVLKVRASTPLFEPRYGIYSHRLGNTWLVGGASNSGGVVLRQYFDDARLTALSAELQPEHPTGLNYYPLTAPGERFPISDPDLAPCLSPRPADDRVFLQGLLEGIARIEQLGYRRLAELGAPYPRCVRTVGGGARNSAWTAIRARLLNTPMRPANHEEAAYGAALLARDRTAAV